MDRSQLEDRIRASLQARAGDVQPTSALWDRVSQQATRRARWQLGLYALAGAAAVVVLALGGFALLRTPAGLPPIGPSPEQTPTPDPTSAPAPVPGEATVVTADSDGVHEVDPATGEVITTLPVFEGFAEGGPIGDVAVRPVSADGELVVASTIAIEAQGWGVEVSVFDANRSRTDRKRVQVDESAAAGVFNTDTEASPPTVVWSPDGRYLAWVRVGEDATNHAMVLDWEAASRAGDGAVQPIDLGELEPAEGIGHLRAQSWTGGEVAQVMWMTRSGGGDATIEVSPDCLAGGSCDQIAIGDLGMEGGSIIDLAHHGSGTTLALVARGSATQDAEGGSLELIVEPMDDNQHPLDVPAGIFPEGTASPVDGWLAGSGDRFVVGFGGRAALLTVTGELAEDVQTTDSVDLPEGTTAADVVALSSAPSGATDGSSEVATTSGAAPVGEDGVPEHVVVSGDDPGQMDLVDRAAPDQPLATWGRPDGVDGEMTPIHVAVHPASTPNDLQLVTLWSIGEAQVLARTVVQDGEAVANHTFDAEGQPDNRGGAAEIADSSPVFSPDGLFLAWLETPQGSEGPAQVRIVSWTDDGPTGPTRIVPATDDVARPIGLKDWARQPDGDVLTMTPAPVPGDTVGQPELMVELRLRVNGGIIAESNDDDWRTVDLPGILFDAGSFTFEDGTTQRYIAFDGGDELLYSQAQSPDTAVPTGAFAFSEGRVVAFGPDSALVRRADGAWQRVQVDTGAASPVDMPDATRAILPWST